MDLSEFKPHEARGLQARRKEKRQGLHGRSYRERATEKSHCMRSTRTDPCANAPCSVNKRVHFIKQPSLGWSNG